MARFDNFAVQMETFQHIDDFENNFLKIQDVISDRMYGDLEIDSNPWLSVLIPTYQRRELFCEALTSVLSQNPVTYCWEVLVVDNTPADDTGTTPALEVIREIGDPRVIYYHNRENIGSGYNWNRGVELARGMWICFLHDDDLLCPDALQNIGRQLSLYRGKRPLGFLHSRVIEFMDSFVPPPSKHFPPERLSRFGVTLSGCTGAGAPTCGTTVLKKAYLEVGGINYDYGGSADMVICYQIMRDYGVVCSDRVLGGYRWNDNETLKKDVLLQLIQTDELLSRYTYTKSAFAAWWGRVFGAASSWRNVYRKQKTANEYGVAVTKKDFSDVVAYPEPSWIKKNLFLAIYAFYRVLRLIDGWITAII